MGRRPKPPPEYTATSFVKVRGVYTCTDDLTSEQRDRVANIINLRLLNFQYAGVAKFYVPGYEDGYPGERIGEPGEA